MGMRVEAVWKPARGVGTGLQNIEHFRPTGEPDADVRHVQGAPVRDVASGRFRPVAAAAALRRGTTNGVEMLVPIFAEVSAASA